MPFGVILVLLMLTNTIENALISVGVINPVVSGIGTIPVVTAALIVLLIYIMRKQKVADI